MVISDETCAAFSVNVVYTKAGTLPLNYDYAATELQRFRLNRALSLITALL